MHPQQNNYAITKLTQKVRFGRLLLHPAWERNRSILKRVRKSGSK